jgi:hypothetical protein
MWALDGSWRNFFPTFWALYWKSGVKIFFLNMMKKTIPHDWWHWAVLRTSKILWKTR